MEKDPLTNSSNFSPESNNLEENNENNEVTTFNEIWDNAGEASKKYGSPSIVIFNETADDVEVSLKNEHYSLHSGHISKDEFENIKNSQYSSLKANGREIRVNNQTVSHMKYGEETIK